MDLRHEFEGQRLISNFLEVFTTAFDDDWLVKVRLELDPATPGEDMQITEIAMGLHDGGGVRRGCDRRLDTDEMMEVPAVEVGP